MNKNLYHTVESSFILSMRGTLDPKISYDNHLYNLQSLDQLIQETLSLDMDYSTILFPLSKWSRREPRGLNPSNGKETPTPVCGSNS